MKTLLLDPTNWDLMVDASNNIAVAANPYALAQDAASAIKLFEGEQYYDTTQGVPYWAEILGKFGAPLSLVKKRFVTAALTVPEVVGAQCFIQSFIHRELRGQVQVTDKNNIISPPVSFTT
jgi:hypothetical protein